jgi:peptidyl-prolyl cis-trans isomerase SurA
MKHQLWALALAACGLCQVQAVHAQRAVQADFIVALINSEPITNNDLRAAVALLREQLAAQRQPMPAPDELRQAVLERLINERAQLQTAKEVGIRIDESAVDVAEQNIARQNQLDVAGLRKSLLAEGVDPQAFRARVRDQLVLARLREREVDSRIRVTDGDVDRYLSDLQAKNADPLVQEINIAQLLVAVPENGTPDQIAGLRTRAQGLLQRARAGEDFAVLVEQFSDAPRANGGQMGLRRGERYPPLFLDAVRNVPVGAVSEVLQSGAGFHILKVVERRAGTPTVSVVQSRARHILLRTSPELSQGAAIERLLALRQRVVSRQSDFAALAREFSQDGSAAQGGDLGWASPGMFVPEFEEVMNQLGSMEISQPLVSRFGVHLVQLLERRRMELSPSEMREFVRNTLRQTRTEEAYANWSRDIRGRAFVELREPPL